MKEQYETPDQGELRASNEELRAINKELRSAGKELETGKEELQWAIEYCRRARKAAPKDKKEFWRHLHSRAELLLLKLNSFG